MPSLFVKTRLIANTFVGSAITFATPLIARAEGEDAEHKIKQVFGSVSETIRAALKGDYDAQMKLVSDYAAPALLVCALLVVSYTIASAIGRMTGKIVSRKVDLTLGKFLAKAVRNVLMIIVAMMVLEYFDINVTGFAAILAAAGFAVGMALQGTLSNFAAGVMLLMFRPFKVNDYIVVAGTEGTVEEIDLFTTRLNSPDNRHLIIPNGQIFGNLLENYSRNEVRRVDVNVGAAYSADLDQTRQALEKAVQRVVLMEGTDPNPGQVCLMGLGASSVDWQVRAWCQPAEYWNVRERLTAAAKQSLDSAGISIPYPQMDVNVVGKMLTRTQAA